MAFVRPFRKVVARAGAVLLAAAAVGVVVVPGVAAAALPAGCTQTGSMVTCSYGFTGAEQT